jgi:uncharacterized membrane protein
MPTSALNVAAKSAIPRKSTIGKTMESMPKIDRNVGDLERLFSTGLGGFFAVRGIAGRGINPLALCASAFLLYRGLSGNCPLTQAIANRRSGRRRAASIIPARQGIRVEDAVTIRRPANVLYDAWRDLSRLPRFMNHLVEVREDAPTRSHWVARGPLGLKIEWDAEIFNDTRDQVIAWRSLPRSDIDTAGSVHFRTLPQGVGTEVRVNLKYDAPAGKLGTAIGSLLGHDPRRQIHEDLQRFKRLMEGGEIAKKTFQSIG